MTPLQLAEESKMEGTVALLTVGMDLLAKNRVRRGV